MHERNRQRGFTLVEAMLSLVILAMLMASIGVAIKASFDNYRENEKIAAITQTGRVVMDRISREVRTAQAVDYDYVTLTLGIIPPDDGSGITLLQYQHDYDQGLLYTVTKDGTATTYVLIGNGDEVRIQEFYVEEETGKDWQGVDCTKSVTIRMGLTIDERSYELTSTAAPRRNQIY